MPLRRSAIRGGRGGGKGERRGERRASVDGPHIERSTLPRSSRKSGSQFLASRNLCSWHMIMSREVALLSSSSPPFASEPRLCSDRPRAGNQATSRSHGTMSKTQPTKKNLNATCIENEVRMMFRSVSRWRVQLSQHGQLLKHWTRPSRNKHILSLT